MHILFVPIILWTSLVWISTPHFGQVDVLGLKIGLNASLLVTLIYSLFYISLEPFAGVTWTVLFLPAWFFANHFRANFENAIFYSILVHVIAWIAQFAAHGLIEKRAPALLDSLLQALLLAPLFVWLEVLFMFGYRKKLKEDLQKVFIIFSTPKKQSC